MFSVILKLVSIVRCRHNLVPRVSLLYDPLGRETLGASLI